MMTALEFEKQYSIDENEVLNISGLIVNSFYISPSDSYKKEITINNKEAILDSFAATLEKMLTLKMHLSREKKMEIVNILNKLNAQREYMELMKESLVKGDTVFSDLMVASERLSKKVQSAFDSE